MKQNTQSKNTTFLQLLKDYPSLYLFYNFYTFYLSSCNIPFIKTISDLISTGDISSAKVLTDSLRPFLRYIFLFLYSFREAIYTSLTFIGKEAKETNDNTYWTLALYNKLLSDSDVSFSEGVHKDVLDSIVINFSNISFYSALILAGIINNTNIKEEELQNFKAEFLENTRKIVEEIQNSEEFQQIYSKYKSRILRIQKSKCSNTGNTSTFDLFMYILLSDSYNIFNQYIFSWINEKNKNIQDLISFSFILGEYFYLSTGFYLSENKTDEEGFISVSLKTNRLLSKVSDISREDLFKRNMIFLMDQIALISHNSSVITEWMQENKKDIAIILSKNETPTSDENQNAETDFHMLQEIEKGIDIFIPRFVNCKELADKCSQLLQDKYNIKKPELDSEIENKENLIDDN